MGVMVDVRVSMQALGSVERGRRWHVIGHELDRFGSTSFIQQARRLYSLSIHDHYRLPWPWAGTQSYSV